MSVPSEGRPRRGPDGGLRGRMGVAVGVTVAVLAFMAVMATANEHSQQQKKRPHSQAHAEEKIPNAQ